MVNDAQNCAVKLEYAFRRGDTVVASSDEFRLNFKSAFEMGLASLEAQGLLSPEDTRAWLDEYSFADNTLDEILQSAEARERIEELYRRAMALKN